MINVLFFDFSFACSSDTTTWAFHIAVRSSVSVHVGFTFPGSHGNLRAVSKQLRQIQLRYHQVRCNNDNRSYWVLFGNVHQCPGHYFVISVTNASEEGNA